MKFISFGPSGDETPGWLNEGGVLSLAPLLGGAGLESLIADWPRVSRELRLLREVSEPIPLAGLRLGPPLTRPPKIIGVGANYAGPDGQPPKGPPDPILFFKPASSLVGHDDPVILPFEAANVVAEVELVIVIGKAGRRIAADQAMDHVFGYTIANDVTAPEVMVGDALQSPFFFQQGRGKGFPSFCPLGPWIVTRDEIEDPSALWLEQSVNGETELSGSSGLMQHSVAALVAEVSHAFGLEPGDLILSGSPRPSGQRRPLADGDLLESRISGVGVLRNPVLAERQDGPAPIRRYEKPAGGY